MAVNPQEHVLLKAPVSKLGDVASSVVLTLAYFSLFRHPLKEKELLSAAHFYPMTPEVGREAIRSLVKQGILEVAGDNICLHGGSALAKIRVERKIRAVQWHERSLISVKILAKLPFLRGLLISGSMSKNVQDPDGDIDFLVLTAMNRMWTARFFASLMLRFMPRSRQRYYCLNYFLPEDHLDIRDQTLFSATEVAFLKPAINKNLCDAFFKRNKWVKNFYPNWNPPEQIISSAGRTLLQRLLEWPLSGHLGDLLESKIRKILMRRYFEFSLSHQAHGAATDARFGSWEIKGHYKGRGEEIRKQWNARIAELETQLSIRLVRWPWRSTPTPAVDIRPSGFAPEGKNVTECNFPPGNYDSSDFATTVKVSPHRL